MIDPAPLSLANSAIGGDVVGRDKIVNNIQNIYQRALTAAEEATRERSLEMQVLAQGVSAIAARLQSIASETDDAVGLNANPYKGLLAYRLSDAEIFFGRSQAVAAVWGRMQRGRLTVLHSESGAGKSSLLQAGIAPRLIGEGHLPLYLRPYNNYPGFVLKRAFISDLGQTPLLASAPLREFLRQVTQVLGPQTTLHICLDQFEEFFTQLNEPARQDFANELAECLDDESLNVHWLLSLRTEFFGSLATLRPQIRNPFENDFRLDRLKRAEAQEVITEPAKRRGVAFETGLVDTILDDLGQNDIAPPQMQLVCSALYEALPAGEKVITRAIYAGLGGAVGILREHLDRVLNRDLLPDHRPIARSLMESLITADGRRMIKTHPVLAQELNARREQPILAETLSQVLDQLVDSHLLRAQEAESEGGEGYEVSAAVAYELAHDYLLEQITLDPAVQARKAAQELLDQETDSYVRYQTLLSEDKLAILAPRREQLLLNDPAKQLLAESEKRVRRKRGFVFGGIGLVIVLIVLGVFAAVTAITAQMEEGVAVLTQQAAQTAAAAAGGREAQAVAAEQLAQLHQDRSEAAANAAATNAAEARALAATAESRAGEVKKVVDDLFIKNGIVPVGFGPAAFAFDGQYLWIINEGDGVLQAIDPVTGEIARAVEVGKMPAAILFDGQRLWVANAGDNTIQSLDPASGALGDPVRVGAHPNALAFDGRQLWVANRDDATALAVSIDTRAVSQPIPIGRYPTAMIYANSKVWVANRESGAVQAIDPATGRVVLQTEIGVRPVGLAFDGRYVWVTVQGNGTAQAIDPETGKVEWVVEVGSRPGPIVFDARGQHLWIANQGSNTVRTIHTVTGEVGQPYGVGRLPTALAFAGDWLWVANFSDNTVLALDPTIGDIGLPIQVGRAPRALAFDGTRLWVANQDDNTVQWVDPTTHEVSQPIAVGAAPRALAFDGTRVWVANSEDNTIQSIDSATRQVGPPIRVGNNPRALAFDGLRLWIANRDDNTVQPIDPETDRAAAPLTVGKAPVALAFDGRLIWVANQDEDTVHFIVPTTGELGEPIPVGDSPFALLIANKLLWVTNQTSNTVQTIDPATNKAVQSIPVGANPLGIVFDGEFIWVSLFADNAIQPIDLAGDATYSPVTIGAGPIPLAFDGKRLWVASRDTGMLQYLFIHK